MATHVIVIGITGITRSGKSTISSRIAERLSKADSKVAVVGQDSFFQGKVDITVADEQYSSSEEPECTDYVGFAQAITAAIEDATRQPQQATVSTSESSSACTSVKFVIVEGHQMLCNQQIRELLTSPVFWLDFPKEESCRRRTQSRSLLNPNPQTPWKFNNVTWPSFQRYITHVLEPRLLNSEIALSQGDDERQTIDLVDGKEIQSDHDTTNNYHSTNDICNVDLAPQVHRINAAKWIDDQGNNSETAMEHSLNLILSRFNLILE